MSEDDLDTKVKVAIYEMTAETGRVPSSSEISGRIDIEENEVLTVFGRLHAKRLLLPERGDSKRIRMAPPFSGVPTQHVVIVGETKYFANCAWDSFGIPAALHRPGRVYSRCEQSGEPLLLEIGLKGPPSCSWLFHCLVPAAKWWDDIVFT